MRLTKQMKENLYTIIVNKTTKPFTHDFEQEMKNKIQKIVWKQEPIFKNYYDVYCQNGFFPFNLNFADCNHLYDRKLLVSLPIYLPHSNNQLLWLLNQEGKIKFLSYSQRINCVCQETLELFKEEYQEVFKEILDKLDEYLEYNKVLDELRSIINTFTTDTALAQAYPEFKQYFLKAGIYNTSKKHLPSLTGLPNVLEKYGVKLSKDIDTLAEEIKEEMNQDE